MTIIYYYIFLDIVFCLCPLQPCIFPSRIFIQCDSKENLLKRCYIWLCSGLDELLYVYFFTQMAFTFQGPVVMNQIYLFVCWFKLCILEHTLRKSLQAVMLAVCTHTCTTYIHHFSHSWDLNIHALVFIFKISFRYGY
jgi:hypothetical protein